MTLNHNYQLLKILLLSSRKCAYTLLDKEAPTTIRQDTGGEVWYLLLQYNWKAYSAKRECCKAVGYHEVWPAMNKFIKETIGSSQLFVLSVHSTKFIEAPTVHRYPACQSKKSQEIHLHHFHYSLCGKSLKSNCFCGRMKTIRYQFDSIPLLDMLSVVIEKLPLTFS